MLQEKVLVRDRTAAGLRVRPSHSGPPRRKEILRVLERASQDDDFIARLTDRGDEVLREYELTWQEKAALLSGDIRWIEARLGRLNAQLRTWLNCRLEQEKW